MSLNVPLRDGLECSERGCCVAVKLRQVALLGAFEIAPELETPVRDGLILGSRRDSRGFVIETSRENIELIVTASNPAVTEGLPKRLTLSVGPMLERLGAELLRVELRSVAYDAGDSGSSEGTYVQGFLVLRLLGRRPLRLSMTATEAIQVAIAHRMPMMAEVSLLTLDVSQFLDEIDTFATQVEAEKDEFRSFVDSVTPTDFARYLKDHPDAPEGG